MDEKSLKSEIRKCRKFARKGAKLSREQLKKLSITLDEAKTNIPAFSTHIVLISYSPRRACVDNVLI